MKLFSKKDYKEKKGEDSTDTSGFEPSNEYEEKAYYYLEGLGGKSNIDSLTNCATRLRLELKDNTIIDEQKIRNAGAVGVTKNGHHSTQVIIGTHVQQVADEIEKQLK